MRGLLKKELSNEGTIYNQTFNSRTFNNDF